MTFRLVPEETTRIALLRRGEVDVVEISRERVRSWRRKAIRSTSARKKPSCTLWWILGPDGRSARRRTSGCARR